MKMNGVLNKRQVIALFQEEAMLIGSANGVPQCRAEELFGVSAVRFVTRNSGKAGSHFNTFFVDSRHSLPYLTLSGFLDAAGCANVSVALRELEAEQRKAPLTGRQSTISGK